MLDICYGEVIRGERTANDLQVEKWIRVVSVVLRPLQQKMLGNVAEVVSLVVDSSKDLPNPASNIPIVGDEIVEK